MHFQGGLYPKDPDRLVSMSWIQTLSRLNIIEHKYLNSQNTKIHHHQVKMFKIELCCCSCNYLNENYSNYIHKFEIIHSTYSFIQLLYCFMTQTHALRSSCRLHIWKWCISKKNNLQWKLLEYFILNIWLIS